MKRVSLFLFLVLAACGQQKQEPRLEAFPVQAVSVQPQPLEDALVVVGSLKARNEATLFSRVPGKLLRNLLKDGDLVKKGQAVSLVERDEVGVEFRPAPVPSTLDGVVGRVYLDEGANVKTDTPVALVMDVSQIVARADVPERYAGRIRLGQAARVTVGSFVNREFLGRISRVSPAVDPVTRAMPVEITMDNPGHALKSGMFAQVSIVVERRNNVLAVPPAAVVQGDSPSVFVVEGGVARKRAVTLGMKTTYAVEISSGLTTGDQVITFGLFALKDSAPVEVIGKTPEPIALPSSAE